MLSKKAHIAEVDFQHYSWADDPVFLTFKTSDEEIKNMSPEEVKRTYYRQNIDSNLDSDVYRPVSDSEPDQLTEGLGPVSLTLFKSLNALKKSCRGLEGHISTAFVFNLLVSSHIAVVMSSILLLLAGSGGRSFTMPLFYSLALIPHALTALVRALTAPSLKTWAATAATDPALQYAVLTVLLFNCRMVSAAFLLTIASVYQLLLSLPKAMRAKGLGHLPIVLKLSAREHLLIASAHATNARLELLCLLEMALLGAGGGAVVARLPLYVLFLLVRGGGSDVLRKEVSCVADTIETRLSGLALSLFQRSRVTLGNVSLAIQGAVMSTDH
eukprot:gnl/Dysnectes_brevis/2165_a2519_1062.p1 GENE.gnl/Dysnectes_brevis/2165_a2519_1062~~gnl/Dysnectes_brevis/2165_a2519_1062.p1  ORF type:complete len:328 (+),score=60.31 gnl/Dysnectes_brevis/2165_a2519_1062:604-1587(+)